MIGLERHGCLICFSCAIIIIIIIIIIVIIIIIILCLSPWPPIILAVCGMFVLCETPEQLTWIRSHHHSLH